MEFDFILINGDILLLNSKKNKTKKQNKNKNKILYFWPGNI